MDVAGWSFNGAPAAANDPTTAPPFRSRIKERDRAVVCLRSTLPTVRRMGRAYWRSIYREHSTRPAEEMESRSRSRRWRPAAVSQGGPGRRDRAGKGGPLGPGGNGLGPSDSLLRLWQDRPRTVLHDPRNGQAFRVLLHVRLAGLAQLAAEYATHLYAVSKIARQRRPGPPFLRQSRRYESSSLSPTRPGARARRPRRRRPTRGSGAGGNLARPRRYTALAARDAPRTNVLEARGQIGRATKDFLACNPSRPTERF